MKKIQIFILLSAFLFSVYTANLRNTSTSGLQQYLDNNSESQIVKDLISTVQLHLKSGGKVKEVITYIKESRNSSETDKVNLVAEFQGEMDRFDTEIAQQNTDLRNMNQELNNTINQIASLQGEIIFLTKTQKQLEADLVSLNGREEMVTKSRENDVENYRVRQQRDTKAINALTEIIPQLQDLLNGGETNIEQATELLQKKQLNKHVMSLLQTSLKFSKAKLETVIEKLEHILEAVKAAKDNDERGEAESETRFNQLISEISNVRTQKKAQLSITVNTLNLKSSDLITARANQNRLETNIETTTKLRDQNISAQEASRKSYQRRVDELNVTIQALNDVLEILENNSDKLSNQSDDADSRQQ